MAFLDYAGLTRYNNKIKDKLNQKAPLESPVLTGTPVAPTAALGTDTTQIATTGYVMRTVGLGTSMSFQGTYGVLADDPTITELPSTPQQGWVYKVISSGLSIGSKELSIGDTIACVDPNATGSAKWAVIPTNEDGAVTGPNISGNGNIAVFNGTDGDKIKDSGSYIETAIAEGVYSENLPTSSAVVGYISTKLTNMQDAFNERLADIDSRMNEFVDGGHVEEGVAYFTNGQDELFQITGIGGGGGSATNVVMTCVNGLDWSSKKFPKGATVDLKLEWYSTEDGVSTGAGSVTIEVGPSRETLSYKDRLSKPQGIITIPVTKYLSDGENKIKLTVRDSQDNARSKYFTVNIENVYIESTFNSAIVQTGPIKVSFTPHGNIKNTVHFKIDEHEYNGETVDNITYEDKRIIDPLSDTGYSQTLPAQSHGNHTLYVWMSFEMDGVQQTSNILTYDIICVEDGNQTPIVSSNFNKTTIDQYSTVVIPYMVYTPNSLTSDVTISINGVTVLSAEGVGREVYTDFSHRFDDYDTEAHDDVPEGKHTIVISSGNASKTMYVHVTSSGENIQPVTSNMALYLTSKSRSNSEPTRNQWISGSGNEAISCTLSNFDWKSNGWIIDKDNVTALRINGSASVTIPYKIFGSNFTQSGKTIEIEFATRDVRDYSAVWFSCVKNGRGLQITAQDCFIASEQTKLETQFKEDEHVRLAFVVDQKDGLKLVRCYVNAVLSSVAQYPSDDNFAQVVTQEDPATNITISGNGNTIDIYNIRIYDIDLTDRQIENNWIADTANGALMLERYSRNNIRDEFGRIVTSKLPGDLPYLIIKADALPQYKGNKLTCAGSYTDPANKAKSFEFTDAQIDVQGTSSQYYRRKNYKIKFNGGFIMNSGTIVSKYALRDISIPVKTFCFKADVASSEGANNVELVRLYNDTCPYKTPAQVENQRGHTADETYPKVRQGIDGFPIVIFWHNTKTDEVKFLGKNMLRLNLL